MASPDGVPLALKGIRPSTVSRHAVSLPACVGHPGGSTMTCTVTLRGGEIDTYMRFGDAYVKHGDGRLDVIRNGVKRPLRYAPGEWTDVQGDERSMKSRFWG